MLHRRRNTVADDPYAPEDGSDGPVSGTNPTSRQDQASTTYMPLRRESSGLYATPASGLKARYPEPSPPTLYSNGHIPMTVASSGSISAPIYSPSLQTNDHLFSRSPISPRLRGANLTPDAFGSSWDGHRGETTYYGRGGDRRLDDARRSIQGIRNGFRDAIRLDRSWGLVWGDPELRSLVLKSTLINLLSLVLLSIFPLILDPILSASHTTSQLLVESRTREVGLWYNLLLSWPLLAVCFWVNASWGPDISRRAQTLLHPSYRHQPSAPNVYSASAQSSLVSSRIEWLWSTVTRCLLIADFTLVSRLISLVPLVGRPAALAYMAVINAYYAFEWTFVSRQWPIEYRTTYVQDRIGFMFGFGLPATLLSTFGPLLVNMAMFALLYPFFVIQALQSRPHVNEGTSTLLPSTPSPRSSVPATPMEGVGSSTPALSFPFNSPRIGSSDKNITVSRISDVYRVPIFLFARYALNALRWLENALSRDRAGGPRRTKMSRDRPGKRQF